MRCQAAPSALVHVSGCNVPIFHSLFLTHTHPDRFDLSPRSITPEVVPSARVHKLALVRAEQLCADCYISHNNSILRSRIGSVCLSGCFGLRGFSQMRARGFEPMTCWDALAAAFVLCRTHQISFRVAPKRIVGQNEAIFLYIKISKKLQRRMLMFALL